MTTIKVDLRESDGTPSVGSLVWVPTRRRHVNGPTTDTDYVILPASFVVPLVAGKATVTVDPTQGDWAWRVTETGDGGSTRYVAVPNTSTPIAYGDLVDIDPVTLDPEASPESAWWEALRVVAEKPISQDQVNLAVSDALAGILSSGGSVFLVSEPPTSITGSKISDVAINTTNGDLFRLGSSGWSAYGSVKGPKGDPGQDGADGVQGPKGDPGKDGTSVTIQGTVPTVSDLPTLTPEDVGDGYLTDDNGHLHVWSGYDWTDVGSVRGPQGVPGTPGADGQSAAITGVTATTLSPGASATVTLGGTALARTFAFGIPRGDKGDPGTDGTALPSLSQSDIETGTSVTKSAVTASVFKAAVQSLMSTLSDKVTTLEGKFSGPTAIIPTMYIGNTPVSIGNGALTMTYSKSGKLVTVDFVFYIGSTSSFGGAVGYVTLAFPPGLPPATPGTTLPVPVGVFRGIGVSGVMHGQVALNFGAATDRVYFIISDVSTSAAVFDFLLYSDQVGAVGHYLTGSFTYTTT